jgi:hypothetical protein
MKDPALRVLALGLAGIVIAALGSLWWPLTVVGGVLTIAALIWQYRSTRSTEVLIEPADWTVPKTGASSLFSYVIPPPVARRRRKVVCMMMIDGELQEVFADVISRPDGGIEIRSGSADTVIVHMS